MSEKISLDSSEISVFIVSCATKLGIRMIHHCPKSAQFSSWSAQKVP